MFRLHKGTLKRNHATVHHSKLHTFPHTVVSDFHKVFGHKKSVTDKEVTQFLDTHAHQCDCILYIQFIKTTAPLGLSPWFAHHVNIEMCDWYGKLCSILGTDSITTKDGKCIQYFTRKQFAEYDCRFYVRSKRCRKNHVISTL